MCTEQTNLRNYGHNAGKQNIFNYDGETYYLQLYKQLQYIMCCVVLKYMKCSVSAMWMWWSCN